MIERTSRNSFSVVCDATGCDSEEEIDAEEFEEVLDWLRENDWVSKKKAGQWNNFCPNCVKENAKKKDITEQIF